MVRPLGTGLYSIFPPNTIETTVHLNRSFIVRGEAVVGGWEDEWRGRMSGERGWVVGEGGVVERRGGGEGAVWGRKLVGEEEWWGRKVGLGG